MLTQYHVDDVLRLQLAPNSHHFRYKWKDGDNTLQDRGYGGDWVDVIVVATTHEQRDYVCWPSEPQMLVEYMSKSGTVNFHVPIEGHPAFPSDIKKIPGFPWPSNRTQQPISSCGCGNGNDAPAHSDWCPRLIDLKSLGKWDGY
jgi:hypothetical protein